MWTEMKREISAIVPRNVVQGRVRTRLVPGKLTDECPTNVGNAFPSIDIQENK